MTPRRIIEATIAQLALLGITITPLLLSQSLTKAEPRPAVKLEQPPITPASQPVRSQFPRIGNIPEKFILDNQSCPRDGCFCIGSKGQDGKIAEFKCSEQVPTDGEQTERTRR